MAAAGVLLFLAMLVGTLLLILPVFLVITIWGIVIPVIAVERRGVFAAFDRSRQLVRGSGWRVLGVVVLLGMIFLLAGILLTRVIGQEVEGAAAKVLLGSLFSAVMGCLEAFVLGVLYYRLLDIERERAEPASVPQ
jgi:hypothetical protein